MKLAEILIYKNIVRMFPCFGPCWDTFYFRFHWFSFF